MKSYTNKGSLISNEGLIRLVEDGVIEGVNPENINGASIDITLHHIVMGERVTDRKSPVILAEKQNIDMETFEITGNNVLSIGPGDFLLASSVERFNLPANIAAEYKLKSSLARNGLAHLLAGWCDPGWHDSRLTLELHNVTQHHNLGLSAGMKIGQMIFWECDPVPYGQGYDVKGQYNKQKEVTMSKGLK